MSSWRRPRSCAIRWSVRFRTTLIGLIAGLLCSCAKGGSSASPQAHRAPERVEPSAIDGDPGALVAASGLSSGATIDGTIADLETLLDEPGKDPSGELRAERCKTLGRRGDRAAIPVLLRVLEQPVTSQPVLVHRVAADALGRIGDPRATSALIALPFEVPDVPTTTNVGMRAKQALLRIGPVIVDDVVDAMNGEDERIEAAVQAHGIPRLAVTQTFALLLGSLGDARAVAPLLERWSTVSCEQPQPSQTDAHARAVFARALGMIADPRAIEPLCTCATASPAPEELHMMMEALAWIGGPSAATCLAGLVRTSRHAKDTVASADFVFEGRTNAVRLALLAGGAASVPEVRAAMKANRNAKVQASFEQWEPGFEALTRCKADVDCYARTLADDSANWFAREVAAFELARLEPHGVALATKIAAAYGVKNPDARLSIAWLSAHVARGQTCEACVVALESVHTAEAHAMPATYQPAVLMARESIARLSPREPGR